MRQIRSASVRGYPDARIVYILHYRTFAFDRARAYHFQIGRSLHYLFDAAVIIWVNIVYVLYGLGGAHLYAICETRQPLCRIQ